MNRLGDEGLAAIVRPCCNLIVNIHAGIRSGWRSKLIVWGARSLDWPTQLIIQFKKYAKTENMQRK